MLAFLRHHIGSLPHRQMGKIAMPAIDRLYAELAEERADSVKGRERPR
jgi:hypothetical protein